MRTISIFFCKSKNFKKYFQKQSLEFLLENKKKILQITTCLPIFKISVVFLEKFQLRTFSLLIEWPKFQIYFATQQQ